MLLDWHYGKQKQITALRILSLQTILFTMALHCDAEGLF